MEHMEKSRTDLIVVPELPEHLYLPPEIEMSGCPWLDSYVEFSRKWSPEAYDGYHEACGLFVLSTIAARRVAYNFGRTRFTSLYIALAGRSTVSAKTETAGIARALLEVAGLDWLLAPDLSTPQKLIMDMGSNTLPENFLDLSSEIQKEFVQKKVFSSRRGWYFEEFGMLLSDMLKKSGVMSNFHGMFRILDDCKNTYEAATISRGLDSVQQPYLSLLGTLTLSDLLPHAGKGAGLWGDGFLARFALVTPTTDEVINSRFPDEERVFPEDIVEELREWHNRLGTPAYSLTDDSDNVKRVITDNKKTAVIDISKETFDAVYDYRSFLKEVISQSETYDLDGNYGRFPEKALRIAALFASINGDLTIEMKHWAKARGIVERWRTNLHHLYYRLGGPSQTRKLTDREKVIRQINLGNPTAREIHQYTKLNSDQVKTILGELVSSGEVFPQKDGKTTRYFPRDQLAMSN